MIVALDMLKRAWNQGITASLVLFESWYTHDALIAESLAIGYGVICRLKANTMKHSYQGRPFTLEQLWQTVAKKKAQSIHGFPYKGICLKAPYQSGRRRDSFRIRREKAVACLPVYRYGSGTIGNPHLLCPSLGDRTLF
jgi:hypothetical protein